MAERLSFRIKVIKNGPYFVSGGIPLAEQIIVLDSNDYPCEWREGKKYPKQENYYLCRCGKSSNKPFCDGTHAKVNFDGTETASREPFSKRAETTQGPSLKLDDVEDLCAVARFCDRAGGVWELVMQNEDNAVKLATEEAVNCPSGRLVAHDKTGKAIEPVSKKSIGLVNDPQAPAGGPVWVRGGIPIESCDGFTYEIRNRVTLCRCGKSSNKPFCDGSHMPE